MRADDEIVVARMDQDVVDRDVRQVQVERRPVRAAVDRHVDAALVSGEQQPRVARMLAEAMDRRRRQACGDRSPRLPVVVAREDERSIVVVVVPVERRVDASG